MLNQSFRQVFVANTSVLLPSGSTVDLAPGQIGIFDGNTYAATVSPTYGTNKAISIWQGMPDVSHLPLMAGIPQTNQSSKLIKGKLLKKFRRKSASRGQNQKVAIGFDGVDTLKTLEAKCGEVRTVYVKVTGNPIDKLYSTQGMIRQYRLDTGCCEDCGGDSCADVDPVALADSLVEKINNDLKWSAGNGQLLRARRVMSTAISTVGASEFDVYELTIADNGDDSSLTAVQVQTSYPVVRTGRSGIYSTYQVIVPNANPAPTAFTNAGLFTISDCGTCPAGYTLNASGFIYVVVRADAGNPAAITTLNTDYAIAAVGESSSRILRDAPNGISTYLIVSNTANQAAVGSDTIQSIGTADGKCVLTTPSTTAWSDIGDVWGFPKSYKITLADSVCGTSRLTDLQAAYPDLVVTETADGDCVHSFETTVYSDPVSITCGVEDLVFHAPHSFEGVSWQEVAVSPVSSVQAGVVIETAFVNRVTGDCTFDYYPYEADTIHIQVSEYNADYNGNPCENRWPVTELQGVKYPQGVGQRVREQEKKSLSYFLKERSVDPAVREAEGFTLNTDPNQFYDEYTLEFDFKYKVLGWSDTYTDSYHLVVFFPEGKGSSFEQAVLTYAESVGNDVDIEFD
jgi:hypothetical protein